MQHRENNGIQVRVRRASMEPDIHFISLSHQPVPLQAPDSLRIDTAQEVYKDVSKSHEDSLTDSAWRTVEEICFPAERASHTNYEMWPYP